MDIEKYTSGKVYKFFDVLFKLVVWNVLTIILTALAMALPFVGFYILKEGTIAGLLVILGILLGIFMFIPCYCTTFSCIKIYIEEGKTDTLWIYFNRLKDNFKTLYKIELIIFPIVILFTFAISFYYSIIGDKSVEGNFIVAIYQIGYTVLLFATFAIFLCFLNIQMVISYFRMTLKTTMKFTLIMTFKHIVPTMIYLLLFFGPLLIVILINTLIPFWMLIGLSLPQYIMFYISRKDYWRLVNNMNVVRDEEAYLYNKDKESEGKNE